MDLDVDGTVDLDEFANFFSKRKVDRLGRKFKTKSERVQLFSRYIRSLANSFFLWGCKG